jgi:hypothetical protein
MEHPHPHLGSGMSFAASGFALLGGISVKATDVIASHASAWSFDDAKWGISMAVSFTFGAIGVYQHVIERLEKGRQKRQAIETRAKIERDEIEFRAKLAREELEAESRRRRERADREEKLAIERIEVEVRRRFEGASPTVDEGAKVEAKAEDGAQSGAK